MARAPSLDGSSREGKGHFSEGWLAKKYDRNRENSFPLYHFSTFCQDRKDDINLCVDRLQAFGYHIILSIRMIGKAIF